MVRVAGAGLVKSWICPIVFVQGNIIPVLNVNFEEDETGGFEE